MAAPKRLPAQRDSDRIIIERMYLSGKSQAEIGETIGLSQQMIAYEVNKLRASWRTSQIRNWDEARNIELAKLDALEQTFWEAWRESASDGRGGASAYLDGVLRCIDRRIRLLGLDAPTK